MSELEDLKAYIDERDRGVEQRIKLWIISAILSQVVCLIPMIFFLGGIYSDGRASVELLKEQKAELSDRGEWMKERERWEIIIETWARDEGFDPPMLRRNEP